MDESSIKNRMQKSVDNMRKDLAKIRTGTASPAILDTVKVDYYGTLTPINQVAQVTVPEPRTLAIKPWEKNMMQPIEKALQSSDIGITPNSDGTYIRLNMPVLTQDRRKDLAKHAHKVGEDAKIALRNIRREENDHIKKEGKDNSLSEDVIKDQLDSIQALTDKYIAVVDEAIAEKEKDILTV